MCWGGYHTLLKGRWYSVSQINVTIYEGLPVREACHAPGAWWLSCTWCMRHPKNITMYHYVFGVHKMPRASGARVIKHQVLDRHQVRGALHWMFLLGHAVCASYKNLCTPAEVKAIWQLLLWNSRKGTICVVSAALFAPYVVISDTLSTLDSQDFAPRGSMKATVRLATLYCRGTALLCTILHVLYWTVLQALLCTILHVLY